MPPPTLPSTAVFGVDEGTCSAEMARATSSELRTTDVARDFFFVSRRSVAAFDNPPKSVSPNLAEEAARGLHSKAGEFGSIPPATG